MRYQPIKELLGRLEKPVIYLLIGSFVLIEVVISVAPWTSRYIPQGVGLPALLTVILLVFRYIDDRLNSLYERFDSLERGDRIEKKESFSDAIEQLFSDEESVDRIDFFGNSSGSFLPAIKSRNISAKNIRLLIRNPEVDFDIPQDQVKESGLDNRIQDQIRDWESLHTDGIIGEIEIRGYSFEPSIFGVIVDGERGAFGWFYLSEQHPYFHVINTHIVESNDGDLDPLLEDFQTWFDQIYSQYSVPIWEPDNEN